jgi:hypothetical protein
MAVLVRGPHAFMSREPVATPVRLGPAQGLRISGLLWPEARRRLAGTAYVTVERVGAGQVVLFATSPVLRGLVRGTARLFTNAVIYGPGVGARPPRAW